MATHHTQKQQIQPPLSMRLTTATSEERVALLLHEIEQHPEHRLELVADAGQPVELNELDLSAAALAHYRDISPVAPAWWSAEQQGINLRKALLPGAQLRQANLRSADLSAADLRGAALGGANLEGANLEGADLSGADLAGANLRNANLGGANLKEALCEEADLEGAELRFADLRGASLEGGRLAGADLWGANLEQADLQYASLRGAMIREANLRRANLAHVILERADLSGANLQEAQLTSADLQDAILQNTNLQGSVLRDARLQGRSLLTCNLTNVQLSGAWLERTRLQRRQIGDVIGEELAGEYEEAMYGYLALERNFVTLGDTNAASWAYRKRRRMQKSEARRQGQLALSAGQPLKGLAHYTRYAADQFVEWLCDYGESVWRVLCWILVVFVVFTTLYGVTDSVVRVVETPHGVERVPTHNVIDLMSFSLVAMSTSGSPVVGLLPSHQSVHLLTASEALLCIALTGLLGFVIGNRIRR